MNPHAPPHSPPPRTPSPKSQHFSKRASDSLRASLDQLLDLEVQRLKEEDQARREALELREREETELARAAAALAENRARALIAAHEAELAREAEAERRIAAVREEVLREAKDSQARRAAQSYWHRWARHESALRRLRRDPRGKTLKVALWASTLCVGLLGIGGGFRFGALERTAKQEASALLQQTEETRRTRERDVARLEALLKDVERSASATRSNLEEQLALAKQTLAALEQSAEDGAKSPSRPLPAPRRLANAEPQLKPGAKPLQPVAAVAPASEACLPYDPMCFSL